jgi:hypothetical protein
MEFGLGLVLSFVDNASPGMRAIDKGSAFIEF